MPVLYPLPAWGAVVFNFVRVSVDLLTYFRGRIFTDLGRMDVHLCSGWWLYLESVRESFGRSLTQGFLVRLLIAMCLTYYFRKVFIAGLSWDPSKRGPKTSLPNLETLLIILQRGIPTLEDQEDPGSSSLRCSQGRKGKVGTSSRILG